MSELISISGSQNSPRIADLVFVHGLDGDPILTWGGPGGSDDFWPSWLGTDFPDIGIWSLAYELKSSAWVGGAMPLIDRAANALTLMEAHDFGQRPIVFIAHSYGGLLVKKIINHALTFGVSSWNRIATATRAATFLSTPHSGSGLADWFKYLKLLRPTIAIEELQADAPQLRELTHQYRSAAIQLRIRTEVYFETKRYKGLLIVGPASADPGIAGVVPCPMDDDHISICKPESRNSLLFLRTAHLLGRLRDSVDKFIDGQDHDNSVPHVVDVPSSETSLRSPDDEQPSVPETLSQVTSETLYQAALEAEDKLNVLKSSSGERHSLLTNEEALMGHLPSWRHLYMGAYGVFTRVNKEHQILSDIDHCVGMLASRKYGMLLHVLAGDSGCGKSTLAKQIIRRLIEKDVAQELSNLQTAAANMRFLEMRESGIARDIEEEISRHIQPYGAPMVYFIYVDDLFVLEDIDLNRLLQALKVASDKAAIYLFATSPSWIFDRRDLQEKKKTFQLLESIETRIEGIDSFDREALKSQYLEMHGTDCRPDLLEELERAGEVLILFKLALHHNLTYSQYFDQLFKRLEKREPKYLAALLLFSTLARFYVHFPVTLLKQLNLDLDPNDRLKEAPYDYETINDAGLRLFRVRRGTRGPHNPQGMPDTIAPFHDRVAQVIYETWGENRKVVPVFNSRLRDLKNRVYEKLDEDSQSRHILGNVFRGHLRVADDHELRRFVEHFGPVRGNDWILADEPLAATRWLKVSKYRLGRTSRFRRRWKEVLTEILERSADERICLTLGSLSPEKLREPSFKRRILSVSVEGMGPEYIGILLAVLDGFLSSMPLPLDSLAEYLFRLTPWLNRHSQLPSRGLSVGYGVILSLTNNTAKIHSKFRRGDKINQSLAGVVKGYLKNLAYETSTNELLGIRGLLTLARRIQWEPTDAAELTEALFAYLRNRENLFRPVVFEHLLQFALIAHYKDTKGISKMFLDICQNDPRFSSLTYTAAAFWRYVIASGKHQRADETARQILSDLTSGKLADLETSPVYPNFIDGLVRLLIHTRDRGSPQELLAMLRPLVRHFGHNLETPYVFSHAVRLDRSFIETFPDLPADVADRQIRLCFARRLEIPAEHAIVEFIELLTRNVITIPTALIPLLKDYIDVQDPHNIAPALLAEHRDKFYNWLRTNEESIDAAVYFTLANSRVFFVPHELNSLWRVTVKNINLMPHRLSAKYLPRKILDWWLSPRASTRNEEATRAILDAFWQYALHNCHLQFGDRFIIYDDCFLFLIQRFGLDRDEHWWGRALTSLVEYLGTIVRTSMHQSRRRFRIKKESDTEVALYKRRLCLEKILDSVLNQFAQYRLALRGEFEMAVRTALSKYETQPWAARWLLRLDPQKAVDVTGALLNYVSSLRVEEANVFDLRNQVDWWHAWLSKSSGDPLVEINRIANWVKQTTVNGIVCLLLSSLLEVLREQCVKRVWGPLILRIIEDSTPEFSEKSVLVKNYIGYLKGHSSRQSGELGQELLFFKTIALWQLEQAKSMSSSQSSAYGLQSIFEASLEFDLSIDIEKAEEAFLIVCGAQMIFEEGGGIARHFFPWRLRQKRNVDIGKYVRFIETNLNKEQAPYVLAHLLSALAKESSAIGIDVFGQLGDLLKLAIAQRLDSRGTSLAMQTFFERLVAEYETLPDGRNELERVSRDAFDLIEQLIHREGTIYLLTSLLPFWKRLVSFPTTADVLCLWRRMLSGDLGLIEPFARLTRNLGEHLEATSGNLTNGDLLAQFQDSMFVFAETRPGHPLSSKFLSQLARESPQMQRIGELVPRLILHQDDLEDVAYTIGEFLEKGESLFDHNKRIQYEQSIIVTLRSNIYKPHSAQCVKRLLGTSTRKIHYIEIVQLFRTFLQGCRDRRLAKGKNNITRTIEAYYKYESESEIEPAIRKANLGSYLSIIQNTTESVCGAKHFKAIINTWESEFIPELLAMQTLRMLIIKIHPSLWEQILVLVVQLQSLFEPSVLVGPGVSLEVAREEINTLKQEGLISIKRRLAGAC